MRSAWFLCFLLRATLPLHEHALEQPDVQEIIRRSVEATRADWKEAPAYDYFDRTPATEKQASDAKGAKTYAVSMLMGSRYERLVAVNDQPLPPQQEAEEQQRWERELWQRQHETPDQRQKRIANGRKSVERNHLLMEQLVAAFDFTLLGSERIGSYEAYVLRATPRSGYRPPNRQSKVLTGMQGRLWIERAGFHWVKVEAEVVRPVSIEGFLARVEPGTRFRLQQAAIDKGVWLPSQFSVESRAKLFMLLPRREREEHTYFRYHQNHDEHRD